MKIFGVILFLLVVGISSLRASHAIGADLTYKCLGGNNYQVSFSFYRDCGGIGAPASVNLSYKSSCGDDFDFIANQVLGTGDEITEICPGYNSTCSGGVVEGAQKFVYQTTVTVPDDCDTWTFIFDGRLNGSARSGAIGTIVNPFSTYVYVEAFLDRSVDACNNSPVFQSEPSLFLCTSQESCFSFAAEDDDGDSLVYELVTPLTEENGTVSFLPPYTFEDPIASSSSLEFNEANGNCCVTPSMSQTAIMAVKVSEYRNGNLIGFVIRDIQVKTENCANNLPYFTGINGTNSFSIEACVGSQVEFEIQSYDDDVDDVLSISSDLSLIGASINVGSQDQPEISFVWDTSTGAYGEGSYDFQVTVEDDNCPFKGVQSYSFTVVLSEMEVDLGPDKEISCVGNTILSPTVISGGIPTYNWSNGDVSALVSVGPGSYSVIVTGSNGCVETDEVVVGINNNPDVEFSTGPVCIDSPILFEDNSSSNDGTSISDRQWLIGDIEQSLNSSFTYESEVLGNINVKLIITTTLGCVDSLERTIEVHPNPVADFSFTGTCSNDSFEFVNNSSISSGFIDVINWRFPDGSEELGATADYIFNGAGGNEVSLELTSNEGCKDTLIEVLDVKNPPVANFNAFPVCGGNDTIIEDLSLPGDAVLSTYQWTIEGVRYTNIGDVRHVFIGSGEIPAELIVEDANACSDTINKVFTTGERPVPSFIADSYCEYEMIDFNGEATISQATSLNYFWTINNDEYEMQNVSTDFRESGIYPVKLKVVAGTGCADSITQMVSIKQTPTVQFSVEDVCAGEESVFINNSSSDESSITDIDWDFNGLGSSNEENPTFEFPSDGEYLVSLEIENALGCSNDTSILTTAESLPIPSFDFQNVCEDVPYTYTSSSTIQSGSINTYQWKQDDQLSSVQSTFSFNPGQAGDYQVRLIVGSISGCTDSISHTITVHPKPVVDFTIENPCEDKPISFVNQSAISSGSINEYSWSFGFNNEVSTEESPVNIYDDPGIYSIDLSARSNFNCGSSQRKQLKVYARPLPVIQSVDVCSGSNALFENLTRINDDQDLNSIWMNGNDTLSTDTELNYQINQSGEYTVKLISWTEAGCLDSTNLTIEVFPLPEIAYSSNLTNGCAPLCVDVNPEISIESGEVDYYVLDVSADRTFTNEASSHCYEESGGYDVSIVAFSDKGCRMDTLTESYINVYERAEAALTVDKEETDIFDPSFEFQSMSSNADSILWILNGVDSITDDFFSYKFNDTGTYNVELFAITRNSCNDTAFTSVRVNPVYVNHIPTAFSPNEDGINEAWKPIVYAVNYYRVLIYDRWGSLMFESNDINEAWDGRKRGKGNICPVGVYVYQIKTVDVFGIERHYDGTISLLK